MTKCAECRQEFKKLRMTQKTCSPECALPYGKRVALQKAVKDKRKADKIERAQIKERRENLKSKSEVAKELQIIVNQYVRARDLKSGHGCISCGTKTSQIWDAGHFRSVGSSPHLRFDTRNIHLQCRQCNSFFAGNLLEYAKNLPARIGQESFDALLSDQTPRHYTKDDLQSLKTLFRQKTKDLNG